MDWDTDNQDPAPGARYEEACARYEDACARLEARADRLEERLARFGRYGLALEIDEFEFLMDPLKFWGPPRVLVRRGHATAEIWLDHETLSLVKPSRFPEWDERRVLKMVRDNLENLLDAWFHLRNDEKRGRLERNLLVD